MMRSVVQSKHGNDEIDVETTRSRDGWSWWLAFVAGWFDLLMGGLLDW